jgi:hypothetical protein
VLNRLSTLPVTKDFFAPGDLLFKQSVINRGIAKLVGRLGDAEGACFYGQNAFMNIVETLKLTSIGHVDFISYVRQYVKCSLFMMSCLERSGRADDAAQLGKDTSDMVEGIFRSSAEERNQLGSLLLDLYLQRLEVIKNGNSIENEKIEQAVDSGGNVRSVTILKKEIQKLLGTNMVEISSLQKQMLRKYA